MKKYLSVLVNCPVFSGVQEGELLAMLSCMDAQV